MTTTATIEPLTVEPIGDRSVRIVRSFRAPRQLVFDAHTKPELVRRWMGPREWPFTSCEIDLRRSFAYGDHRSDIPVLALVGNPVAVGADPELGRHAATHRWTRWDAHR